MVIRRGGCWVARGGRWRGKGLEVGGNEEKVRFGDRAGSSSSRLRRWFWSVGGGGLDGCGGMCGAFGEIWRWGWDAGDEE